MWQWMAVHWGWLTAGLVLAVYFALYGAALRAQRAGGKERPVLPCDRC